MKFFIISAIVLFSTHTFANPCNGAKGAPHKNPGGSVGGFVANTASVSSSVIVDASSEVCDKAKVQGNSRITERSVVGGEALIEGQISIAGSKVRGAARVFGRAVVSGSTICQASQVNFNVTRSDYYCQTDDEEPNDPGELGKKTLLGIDSNNNGIRDDVEIWINRRFSNTPDKDFYNERMAMKQYAKAFQEIMKYSNTEDIARKKMGERIDSYNCFRNAHFARKNLHQLQKPKTKEERNQHNRLDAKAGDEVLKEFRTIQVEILNTKDRIKADIKVKKYMHGRSLGGELTKNGGTGCTFDYR